LTRRLSASEVQKWEISKSTKIRIQLDNSATTINSCVPVFPHPSLLSSLYTTSFPVAALDVLAMNSNRMSNMRLPMGNYRVCLFQRSVRGQCGDSETTKRARHGHIRLSPPGGRVIGRINLSVLKVYPGGHRR